MPKLSSEKIAATRKALAEADGNRAAAARLLGMSYQAFLTRLKGIDVSDLPGPTRGPGHVAGARPLTVDELVTKHLYVVDVQAHQYKSRLPDSVSVDDLVQAGRIGLMQAAKSFEPQRGIKFATYCVARVRGAMADELRQTDHVPRLTRTREKRRQQCELELRKENIVATPAIVCQRLGWSAAEYRDSHPRSDQSLDQAVFHSDRGTPVSTADLFVEAPPQHTLDRDEAAREIMRGLSLEETCLLYLYHWRGAKMKAIGQAMGLSESRISQLHSEILARLRARGRDFILDRVG